MDLREFCDKHQLVINDLKNIENAFVHATYINEHPNEFTDDYQRLEFMGDAVLQMYSAKLLYAQPDHFNEGYMTLLRSQLVNEKALSQFALELELQTLIKLGAGEMKSEGYLRESLLADIFEALIGALYLDNGWENVVVLCRKTIDVQYQKIKGQQVMDYKTRLQEFVQSDTRKSVVYQEIGRSGPANQPVFESAVLLDGIILGKGKGSSKKESQQQAAKSALEKLVK